MKLYFFLPFLFSIALADDSGLGCFSSVDTSVSKGYNQYQTSSLCASSCGDSYPYVAVKDGGYCYCLLSYPTTDEVSSSECNVKCNGYGSVMCGGTNAYTVFTGLGESGGSLSAGAAASSSSLSSSLKTASTSTLALSTVSTSTSSTSTAGTTTSDGGVTSTLSLGGVSTYTSTSSDSNGLVVFKTVTTLLSSSTSSASKLSNSKSSTNVGAIAGGVVGGVAALVLAGVAIFFIIRRRNADDDDDDEEDLYEKGSGSLNRGTGTGKSKKSNKINPAFDMPMTNPFAHPTDEFADKRMSKMTQSGLTDPRLNPAMMGRRRLSEGSLADETDYLRKILGVANP